MFKQKSKREEGMSQAAIERKNKRRRLEAKTKAGMLEVGQGG